MRNNKNKGRHVPRFVLLFAVLLAACTAWIVFDDLFAPRRESATSVEIPSLCGSRVETLSVPEWIDAKLEYRYDPAYPAGTVIAQSPVGGSRRRLTAQNPRCELRLTVSMGVRRLAMPAVVGQDVRDAERELRELGFSVCRVERKSAYPEGAVLESAPRAGELLPEGATVTLTVSTGAPSAVAIVPDVVGLTRSEALVQLWLNEISLEQMIEIDADAPAGTVVAQSLVAGTRVVASSKITLYVSRFGGEE